MERQYSLYGRLLEKKVLLEAYRRVRRNNGSHGVDKQTVKEFGENLEENLNQLLTELKDKSYRPLPVRRVEIDKNDRGKRKLGIPSVRDRVVQQAVLNLLEPLFDPDFHPSSYGYRKGRSCHQAVGKAQLFIRKYNRKFIVDMDLSKCFDTLDHDLIIAGVRKKVADGSILNLIRLFLKSGVMVGLDREETEVGSPQGGVISPLLANIYLDSFDQFMKSRGHRIVRYADDILILCGSEKASVNARNVAESFLENDLKLTVNRTKTHTVKSCDGVKFLGVKIFDKWTTIKPERVKAFKQKICSLTKKCGGKSIEQVVNSVNPVLRGFINYFRIANCKSLIANLMAWIRRRIRQVQLALWKKPKRLHRRLRQLGYRGDFLSIAMKRWASSGSPLASMAMPDKWIHGELKLVDMRKTVVGITIENL